MRFAPRGLLNFFILCLVEIILVGEGFIDYNKTRGYWVTFKVGFQHLVTLPHMLLSLIVLVVGAIFGFRLIMRGIQEAI